MLSIAPSQLYIAARASQTRVVSRNGNSRLFSTDASGSGAGNRKPGGSTSGGRSQGSYTYKQVFESNQGSKNIVRDKHNDGEKRANLEQHRHTSAKRFSGMRQSDKEGSDGQYGILKGRDGQRHSQEGGRAGGARERAPMRSSAGEVREAREKLEGGSQRHRSGQGMQNRSGTGAMGTNFGRPVAMSSSVTAPAQGRTMDRDGDDRQLEGMGESSSYGGREERGRGGDRRTGSGAARSSSASGERRIGGGGVGRKDGAPSGGAKKMQQRRGRGAGADRKAGEDEESPATPVMTGFGSRAEGETEGTSSSAGGRGGSGMSFGGDMPSLPRVSAARLARVAEMERMEDAEDEAGEKTQSLLGRVVDSELAGITEMNAELDELGEEKLMSDLQRADDKDDVEMDHEFIRKQIAVSQAAMREMNIEKAFVDALPSAPSIGDKAFFKLSETLQRDAHDPVLQRMLRESMPKAYTEQELAEADAMDDVLDPEQMTRPSDLEEEQILMETQFSFAQHGSEISLHSEQALFHGVVDLFDRMVTEKKRHLLVKARKQKRFQIWRAISWPIREKNIAKRNANTKLKHKAAVEKWKQNCADPNMVYYPEVHLWFSKDELRNTIFRNALSAALANPTWNRDKRREFLIGMKRDIVKLATPLPEHKQRIINTIYNIPKKQPSSDLRTVEHLLPLPITDWSLLMAQAERSMDPADRAKRFEPSPFEKQNNTKL